MNNPTDNKRIATTTVGIICLTIAVVLCCVATFAWFDNSVGLLDFPTNFGGSSMAAYFNGGNGSQGTPYEIANPTNLYNLAWLQYLGYFNLRSGLNNGRAQTYFKLTSNIDMSEVASYLKALPPIGTSEHPFIGQFDGNNKTVSKLNVSNKREDYGVYPTNAKFDNSGMLTTCADAADATPSQIEFVAMFGVVGDFNEWVTKSSAYTGNDNNVEFCDSRAEPALNPSPDPNKANQFFYGSMNVGSMYVDNLVVKSYTDKTLVGLAAGYVAGSLKNFGVYRSTINLAGGSKGTTLAKTIDANGNQVAYGNTVSRFSIVGDYDTTLVGWTEKPSGSSGDDNDFGGSVDMRTLNRRINYLSAVTGAFDSNGIMNYTSDSFGINVRPDTSTEFYWNPTSPGARVVYLNDGTVLPLNVDKEKMGLSSLTSTEITKTISSNGRSVTYHTNNEYSSNQSEIMTLNNTGYIVGGGTKSNGNEGFIRSKIQPIASGIYDGIYKSLGYSSADYPDAVYNKSAFEMLTMVGGTNYRIKDNVKTTTTSAFSYSSLTVKELGFVEYDNVRENFDKTMENANVAHGFHFMNRLPKGNAGVNVVSSAEVLERDGVLIDKKYYTTGEVPTLYSSAEHVQSKYQFVKGGLNFTLRKSGYITAILGTFYQQEYTKESLFDLYKVVRTNGKIDSLVKIDNVYKDNETGAISYDPSDTTGKTKVFSFGPLTKNNPLVHGAAYYFEIPVIAGDYVIGAAGDSTSYNAYLMYLDIGANASDDTTEKPTKKYNIDSVDFVNSTTVVVSSDGKYQSYADIVAAISNLQDATQGVVIVFKRDGVTTSYSETKVTDKLLYYYDRTLVTVEFVVSGGTGVVQKTTAEEVLNP